ncbi:aquaporin [Sporichthya polymorpha]|uniref:aquaporin n=1 Tax=Sporichthya polymorpha TaxID=35751 RepID=UPI00036432A3|nr:aquaporin [Sporichthya polymorpha]
MDLLARKAFAEFLGGALLAATVVGSGIAATRLTEDVALQLLTNAVITGAVLVALILALGPVSAAFNPVVTLVERGLGAIDNRCTAALLTAQVAGCCVGVVIANLMFDLSAVDISSRDRSDAHLLLSEVVATFGLVVVIFGVVRAGRSASVAYAVGGYITAAYWFTSSTSFANPAITVGRMLSDTFAGIEPASVPGFVGAQVLGGALALGAVLALYPNTRRVAADLVEAAENPS